MNDLKESLVGEEGKTPHTYLYSLCSSHSCGEGGGDTRMWAEAAIL